MFLKDGNTYTMVDCHLPDRESFQLPVILTKDTSGNASFWNYDTSHPKPVWFDAIVMAIDEYEKMKKQDWAN